MDDNDEDRTLILQRLGHLDSLLPILLLDLLEVCACSSDERGVLRAAFLAPRVIVRNLDVFAGTHAVRDDERGNLSEVLGEHGRFVVRSRTGAAFDEVADKVE